VRARYRWRGRVELREETPVEVRTRAALFAAVASAVRELHPDETPSVIATPIADADPAYAAWLAASTDDAG
jgi:periplasmic divalent cation tolerance protein